MRLLNQHALVTGGSSGIGQAIAYRFAREGARVTVSGNERKALDETVQSIFDFGGKATAVLADVRSKADVERMAAEAVAAFGPIDTLVNSAGVCKPAPFLDIEEADWDLHIDVNLKGTFLCAQAVAREMIKQGKGSIIHISSVNGLAAEGDQVHYNASKAGINSLTMSMALELAPHGIRVNGICPGFIHTRLTQPLIDNPQAIEPYLRTIPLGRIGNPEEIAAAALYLASDDSSYMTGHSMVVDGGQFIKLSSV
ncbi:SDR family NAD(P)-dependent oxidoreductase [Paenibacillus sp. PAMC21692]|uniref:SDR family NAD(P)-dependent oxidoreductase n=1 Tax=Paenibacillus sp. PAMC21692 TaxID=2762320 RepID=UPI00164E9EBD|nr:glucose 1-dehydrogenase [Paenibacillus sp. PAMC21692]QNK59119.1 glucose 1-dehydrogenase [Paenibacillus sp. PAMC21692]